MSDERRWSAVRVAGAAAVAVAEGKFGDFPYTKIMQVVLLKLAFAVSQPSSHVSNDSRSK